MTADRTTTAQQLKQLLVSSSALIEEYTAAVCPACTAVCCKQKHGIYKERDIWYLEALEMPVPPRDTTRPLDGPCEMMGLQGCALPRWMRPFKCTWYFCEPLLKALDEGPQRRARKLSAQLQEMVDLYRELTGIVRENCMIIDGIFRRTPPR